MNTVKVKNIEIGTGIPKICVPIVETSREEILQAGTDIAGSCADIVEWRADWYDDVFDLHKTLETLHFLRDILGEIPLLFTFRTSGEGGEKAIDVDTYVKLNQEVIKSGCADLVDMELFTGEDAVLQVIASAHSHGVKVILSNHEFHKTPDKDELISRLCKMQEMGADISKIAVMPQNKKDVLTLLSATEEMSSRYADRPIITMSMAGTGAISRICGEVFGSALTFGTAGKSSAPGQIDADALREILEVLHKTL